MAITYKAGRFCTGRMTGLRSLVEDHGDSRITQKAFKYLVKPGGYRYAVFAYDGRKMIGASIASERQAISVVHRDYRGKGIGSELLRRRLRISPNQRTHVAFDNAASLAMCKAAGLVEIGRKMGTRKSGPFEIVILETPKPKLDDGPIELRRLLSL